MCRCSGRYRSSPPSPPAATRGGPWPSTTEGGAAGAFRAIADRLDLVIPAAAAGPDGPDMAGCSARLLAAVEVALGDAPVAQSSVS